jgi:hypothetical protein
MNESLSFMAILTKVTFFMTSVASLMLDSTCFVFGLHFGTSTLAHIPLKCHLETFIALSSASLNNNMWVSNYSGALSVGVLLKYLQLWNTLQDINLQSDVEHTHVWRLTSNG